MRTVIVSAVTAACMVSGILVRYAPFSSVVTVKQKRILFGSYILAYFLVAGLCALTLCRSGLEAVTDYLYAGGILISTLLTLVNMAVVPNHIREHMFVFGVVVSIQALLMSVPTYVVSVLPQVTGDSVIYLRIGLYACLLAAVFPVLSLVLRRTIEPFFKLNAGGYWNAICFIPVAYFSAMILFVVSTDEVDLGLQLLSSVLSGSMIILLCLSVAAEHKRLRERQMMEKQLAAQKLHYAELQARVQEARKTKHDFKHHLAAIRHLMDIDDKQGLYAYCDELSERSVEQVRIPYTGNSATDGLVFHYMQLAQRDNIQFQYSGTIRNEGIADMDLCALLGNALDNAYAGCMTLTQGRSIMLIAQSEAHLLSVVVRNTFDGNVKETAAGLLSRKRENRTGIGLTSMQSICDRYGGSMQTEWNEKEFTVMFMLPRTP